MVGLGLSFKNSGLDQDRKILQKFLTYYCLSVILLLRVKK